MFKNLFQNTFLSRFDPREKTKRYQNILTFITGVALLLFTVGMGCFSLYFATGYNNFTLFLHYFSQPLLLVLNILPYVLLAFFVWFLSDQAWIGFFSSSVLCVVYSFAEYWKLAIRSEPLLAEDLRLIGEAVRISDGYLFFDKPMILFVGFILLSTIFLFLFFRGKMPHYRWRLIFPVVLLVICVPLYHFTYTSKDVYSAFPSLDAMGEWIEKEAYIARGGTYPFIYSIQSAFVEPPENYDETYAALLLDTYENDPIPEDRKVNVIFVMYEAYADLSEELGDRLKGDPYSFYHQLQEESYSGNLVVNSYGGGTFYTERGAITGFSALSYHYRHPCWSYAQYFSDNGYVTEGSHGGNEAFYNRLNVNYNLGFDQYYFIENHYIEFSDWYTMDYILLPEITRLSKEHMDLGENLFSFNVTFQNHGPYSTEMTDGYFEYVSQGDLSSENYGIINNYLNGIADTGTQMQNMVESFRFYKEPVVLVFFGDHKPSMGNNGDTYTALGLPVFGENDESFLNTYQTEYVIWANDVAKNKLDREFTGNGPTISPCFLMNLLFEQCGWDGPSYKKLTDEVMKKISVISYHDRYLTDGVLITSEELSESHRDLLDKMDIVQFYLAHDYIIDK